MKYLFSDKGFFYPLDLKDAYVKSGTWPKSGKEVDETVFATFIDTPPEGKVCGVGTDGFPTWVDAPEPTPLPD